MRLLCLLLLICSSAAFGREIHVSVGVHDMAVSEGHEGSREMRVPVQVSYRGGFPDEPMRLEYLVLPHGDTLHRGLPDEDYQPPSGVLDIPPGAKDATIVFLVHGDRKTELSEQVKVLLLAGACQKRGAVCKVGFSRQQAIATIVNDERPGHSVAALGKWLRLPVQQRQTECMTVSRQVDEGNAGRFCDVLSGEPAGGNGLTTSVHFPTAAITRHGLMVLPDSGGFPVVVEAYAAAAGEYVPFSGPLQMRIHPAGQRTARGPVFEGVPDPEMPGRHHFQLPVGALTGTAGRPGGGAPWEFVIASREHEGESTTVVLENLLLGSGTEPAMLATDLGGTWQPGERRGTPVWVLSRAGQADPADLCPLELLSSGIEGRSRDPVACIAEARATCLTGSSSMFCLLPDFSLSRR